MACGEVHYGMTALIGCLVFIFSLVQKYVSMLLGFEILRVTVVTELIMAHHAMSAENTLSLPTRRKSEQLLVLNC